MDGPSILPILKQIPIFSDLTEEEHKQIIKGITLQYYPAGHMFFHEGDKNPDDAMYIIKHGMVKITRRSENGDQKEVATLLDHQFFGEMALIQDEPRNATAVCGSDCEVFELKKSDFLALMQSSPTLGTKISEAFVAREKTNPYAK